MKKITLLVLTLCIGAVSHAQFPEDFEGVTFPPAGWTTFVGANGLGTVENWESGAFDTTTAVCVWEVLPAGQRSEDWLVTPQVAITSNNSTLTFQAVDSGSTDYGSIYTIRVSTASQTTHSDFTIVDTFDETQITHSQAVMTGSERTVDLSAYIGQSIYVAFVLDQNDGDLFRIDNVDFIGGCLDPSVSFDDYTQTTANISMSSVGDFDIEWGEFPYTQGSGGSTISVTATDTYQLTSLMPGVSYNVFVRQNCGGGEFSDYTELVVGTSPDLSTLPIAEDFEPDANQAMLVNFGLSFFSPAGDWTFNADDLTDGDTTNDFANSGVSTIFSNSTFIDSDSDATVYIGPFDLTTTNEYTFSFNQRNLDVASATRPNKDIEIVVATTNDGTTNTVLATFDDMDNTTYQQRMATFTPSVDGSYYFGIRDKSTFLASATVANLVFIDDLSITSTLSTEDFSRNLFTHSYNKSSKSLILQSSNLEMSNVEIYSILGQNVISKPLSSTREVINIASLNDGVYLAKVFADGGSKTIKFVKN